MVGIIQHKLSNKIAATVNESTLKYNCCIGCSFCEFVCPSQAISMVSDRHNEFKPKVEKDKCTQCCQCVAYCPMQRERLRSVVREIALGDPHSFGIRGGSYWLAFNKEESRRIKSASGGLVTFIAKKMLKTGYVDAVIHAEAIAGTIHDSHYRSVISYSLEELENRTGSFYQALNYSLLLAEISALKKTNFLLIAVPCIISGMKKIFLNHSVLKERKLYTLALACSHNVNSQYVSFLAEAADIPPATRFTANLRAKDLSEKDANNYHTRFLSLSREILYSKNRFLSYFTYTWRNYFFAKNACLYCSDFWGYEADFSVKDAWGKWSQEDKLGKSIIVARNKNLEALLIDNEIELTSLSFSEIRSSQINTTTFKQENAEVKLVESIVSPANIKNGLFRYWVNIKFSKYLYTFFGYAIIKFFLVILNIIEHLKARIKNRL